MSAGPSPRNVPGPDELENLFVNNADLDRIRAYLSRFNPISVMGMERMEIRHSAILGWLLDPQETHGLGDAFLKAFLSEAFRGAAAAARPSALEISQADLMDAEIRREWRNIDLLVLSQRNGWVFIIENKFDSGQHSDQLRRYREIVEAAFIQTGAYTSVRGILLSLWDEEPEDDCYIASNYAAICRLLEQVALSGRFPLKPEVETFIKHYLEVIKEAAGMSDERNEMEKLARQLYRDHKKVLDFLIENGAGSDFAIACESLFGETLSYPTVVRAKGHELVASHVDSHRFSFLPKAWFDALGGDALSWEGCENVWAGFPLIMWVELKVAADGIKGNIAILAEVGPLRDHAFRSGLVSAIESVAAEKGLGRINFRKNSSDEGKRFSRFFKDNTFPVDDTQDPEKISSAIVRALDSFQAEIDAVTSVLPQFQHLGIRKNEP